MRSNNSILRRSLRHVGIVMKNVLLRLKNEKLLRLGSNKKYNLSYPPGYNNGVDDRKLESQMTDLPQNLIRSVYSYLKTDYSLFGYEKPSFL